ncbi:MAG: spinster family MFS transporter, partial [Pseudomonas fluorescens]
MLAGVYSLNLVDRGLMILLLQPIKQDLQLSDSQLGFVTGIAFGLFYATLGLPIAQWADRGNRATITSLAIAVWSVTVAATLLVTNFVQLLCARIAAAVGEAGCKPPTYSLVGDYFPEPAERSRAMAVYFAGGPLSALVSFMAGGWLSESLGWRMTFLLMGVPGLLLAVLVKLTIVEPRVRPDRVAVAQEAAPSVRTVLATVWRQRSSRHLCMAIILLYMITMGLSPWYAAFLMRSHGMGTGEVGTWLGIVAGFGGIAGALLGGFVAARWFGENERGQMQLSAVTVSALLPCFVAFLILPQKHNALIALVPLFVAFNASFGPTYALLQRLVPDSMRATSLSLVMLLANLIGMGVGPLIVGVLSDLFSPALGVDGLRYAMLCLSFVALWSGYHFWQVSRTVKQDLTFVGSVG